MTTNATTAATPAAGASVRYRPLHRLHVLVAFDATSGEARGWHAIHPSREALEPARDVLRADADLKRFRFDIVPYVAIEGVS